MEKELIILRPQPNLNKTGRLGLYKSPTTVSRERNPVKGLSVDLKDITVDVSPQMLSKYNKYGSLIADQVSDWIKTKGYENKESLLFEWWNEDGVDYYHFVGSAVEIIDLFEETEKKKHNVIRKNAQ